MPTARRVGALFDPSEPAVTQEWADTETAARALGLVPVRMEARHSEAIASAFARLTSDEGAILVVFARAFTLTHRSRIIELADRHRIPTVGTGHQSQDRQGAGPDDPTVGARAGGSGDRVTEEHPGAERRADDARDGLKRAREN